ncbi:hypothetical protein [Marinoscillum pacificum]|uniref:hypothetical protein n=1 Tax=Marinoscillum pacificum TaxID=392723 RepID=UPI0021578A13|nr:hypothetical protein [Marinoscillum pacificum]
MHIPLKTWIIIHVCYREIFQAPVLIKDLKRWVKSENLSEIDLSIYSLIEEGTLYSENGYLVRSGNEQFIKNQPGKSETTRKLLDSLKGVTRFLASIPFIKFVGISGSIAAENPTADKVGFNKGNIDIDFYVITARNTLWIFLIFERIFNNLYHLIFRKHTYCFNYCTEEDFLGITNQSFYTSTELNNLLKICGPMGKNEVLMQNLWVSAYYDLEINVRSRVIRNDRKIFNLILKLPNKALYYTYFLLRSLKKFELRILTLPRSEFDNSYKYNLRRMSNPNGGYEIQVSRRFTELLNEYYSDYYDEELIAFLFPNSSLAKSLDPENDRMVYQGYISKYAD